MSNYFKKFFTVTLVIAMLLAVFYFLFWVTYEGLVDIFFLCASTSHVVLGSLLVFFTASFILASVIGMRYYNWFTRWYYYLSSVWMGFLMYLFFISTIYEILGFADFFPLSVLHLIGLALIAVSFVSIIY